jgi:putative Mg2+ transporter-C (MgtC) family protein
MISWSQILLRLSLAAVLGALVGSERERKNWAAGMRTHMMVCVGSTLTMMVSAFGFTDILGTSAVVLDPSRIAAQVISGIGFIGAGTILFLRQEVVRGLTTAAGLWTVAAIGLATGGGMYFAAITATVAVLIILWILKPIERRLFARYRSHTVRIETVRGMENSIVSALGDLLEAEALELRNLTIEKADAGSTLFLSFRSLGGTRQGISFSEKLQSLEGISRITWENGIKF